MIFAPALFTSSPEVMATMRTFLPFMCTALVIHTASMATEGMLLAGALFQPLLLHNPSTFSTSGAKHAARLDSSESVWVIVSAAPCTGLLVGRLHCISACLEAIRTHKRTWCACRA